MFGVVFIYWLFNINWLKLPVSVALTRKESRQNVKFLDLSQLLEQQFIILKKPILLISSWQPSLCDGNFCKFPEPI